MGSQRPLLAALLCVAVPTSAMAQDAVEVSEVPLEDLLGEVPLEEQLGDVVAASGRKEKLTEAPATITRIDAETLARYPARSIPEVLRRVPGVQVFRSAPGTWNVSIRGMGGLQDNNVVVLLNGIRLNDHLTGRVDWASLPVTLAELDYIEVVRGPVSPVYGTDAYAGVIDLRTRIGGSRFGAEGSGGASPGGISGRLGAATEGDIGPAGWHLGAVVSRDAPYVGGDDAPVNRELAGGTFALQHHFDAQTHLTLSVAGAGARATRTTNLDLSRNPSQTQTLLGQATAEHRFESDWLDAVEGYVAMTRNATVQGELGGTTSAFADYVSEQIKGGTSLRLGDPSSLQLSLGADIARSLAVTDILHPSVNGLPRVDAGVRALGTLRLFDAWTLTGGVRYDAGTLIGQGISYRAGVNWSGEDLGVRLVIASGFRTPTPVEAGARFVDPDLDIILLEGNPSLAPQRNTSLELGAIASPTPGLHLSGVLYASRLDDIISEDFTPIIRKTYSNTDGDTLRGSSPVNLVGAELELSWAASEETSVFLSSAALFWPGAEDIPSVTVGVPGNNSTLTLSAGIDSSFVDDRLLVSFETSLQSPRHYAARAGVPPNILSTDTPWTVRLAALANWRVDDHVHVWVQPELTLPDRAQAAPFPGTDPLSFAAFAGVEYRSTP